MKALALMHQGVPGRQAPLLAASGASRTSFVNSLNHLVELGLVERNPGHGHPLRPEFRLTAQGAEIAPIAHRIEAAVSGNKDQGLVRKSWTIPLLAVTGQARPFSVIKRNLSPITDRALSQTLHSLDACRWIERSVDIDHRPPRPFYRAINTGERICEAVGLQV